MGERRPEVVRKSPLHRAPLQRHLTNVLLLQASTFSRSGTFGCGHLLAHMPPHQTMLPHTAPIPMIDNLASLRLILRRSRTGADFLPPHGGIHEPVSYTHLTLPTICSV